MLETLCSSGLLAVTLDASLFGGNHLCVCLQACVCVCVRVCVCLCVRSDNHSDDNRQSQQPVILSVEGH